MDCTLLGWVCFTQYIFVRPLCVVVNHSFSLPYNSPLYKHQNLFTYSIADEYLRVFLILAIINSYPVNIYVDEF